MPATRKITAEARPVGEVFRSKYAVPANQRDFAWRADEQIDALWSDLTDAMGDDREEYFLGAIVVRADTGAFEIVDGQQRLTALSMIFAAIAHAWGGDDRGKEVRETYLGSKDRRSRDVVPKLRLNETNDAVFQAVVLNNADPTATDMRQKSNELLRTGYERICSLLAQWLDAQSERDDALIELEDFVSQSTNLIVIEVGDESDAFVIFETLNDRGMDLAVSDLVKNHLFAKAGGGAALAATKKNWTEIAQAVGSENLTAFLRHYWMSAYEQLRERDLYRRLRASVKGGGKAKQLVASLQKASDHYAALNDPSHPYWADFPTSAQGHVRLLKLLRTTQFRPLALAVMDGGDRREVIGMLRLVSHISFRYVVSGLGANDLEKAYSRAALLVRETGKRNAETIKSLLKGVSVADVDFQRSFDAFAFSKADIARYVLGEINAKIETDGSLVIDPDASLEHIMPRKPSNEWKNVPGSDELPSWVERIGNLTVLEKAVNARLGSKGFDKKKEAGFSKSKLAINGDVVAKDDWTVAEIAERSATFAALAPKIWRIE